MKIKTKWFCSIKGENDFFPASIPGNAQFDYAKAHNWGDVNYADNCFDYKQFEDKSWIYKTEFDNIKEKDKRLYFVSCGIDYECNIYLNGKHIFHHIGMFEKIETDITDYTAEKNIMEIEILPPPKDEIAECDDRSQAAQSTKAAVSYGWDWHPRLIPTGIWQEAYFETRGENYLNSIEPFYTLSDDLKSAELLFETDSKTTPEIKLFNPDGELIYCGKEFKIHLDNIKLWWCNGQGEPSLYRYEASTQENTKSGFIGFRKIELVMNEGAWEEPDTFPKTRSVPPMTLCLNNRRIFAKGSNFIPPEIFYGNINYDSYDNLLKLVKDANMNILRGWGGAVVGKKAFFDLCDKYGIMVWQEFPLACNNYRGTEKYLEMLNREASYIIKSLRSHACHILWCGGNELFNHWSLMTDQSLAIRLLNKLCYELDRNKPFIPTAPIMGMAHGFYKFYDKTSQKTIYDIFSNAHYTAYSEFGIPSISSIERLKEIIPKDEFNNINPGTSWETHHGYNAWIAGGNDTWLCIEDIERYFGHSDKFEDYIEHSLIMQGEGLKFIFEEARRQKPYCSMALNWCFNDVWKVAASESIVSYPALPKKSYYCVKDALRPVLASLKADKFIHINGSQFSAELWLLNDTPESVCAHIDVILSVNGKEEKILTWDTGMSKPNSNIKGHTIRFTVPESDFTVILKSEYGSSSYTFLSQEDVKKCESGLNI